MKRAEWIFSPRIEGWHSASFAVFRIQIVHKKFCLWIFQMRLNVFVLWNQWRVMLTWFVCARLEFAIEWMGVMCTGAIAKQWWISTRNSCINERKIEREHIRLTDLTTTSSRRCVTVAGIRYDISRWSSSDQLPMWSAAVGHNFERNELHRCWLSLRFWCIWPCCCIRMSTDYTRSM